MTEGMWTAFPSCGDSSSVDPAAYGCVKARSAFEWPIGCYASKEDFSKRCLRACLLQVAQNRLSHFGQQRQPGRSRRLCMANPDDLLAPIHVIQPKPGNLAGS